MSTSLKANMTANVAGNIWTAAVALVVIPFYIRFLGMEGYGLIGLYAAIFSIAGVLDFGLSPTLNREMARLSSHAGSEGLMRDVVRTFELVYWAIALAAGLAIAALAPLIAKHWIQAENLQVSHVCDAIRLIGVTVLFQLPVTLYSGGMMGLQRQVSLNLINATMLTLRGGGAIVVLWLVAPTIEAFFIWQALVGLGHVFWLMTALRSSLSSSGVGAVFKPGFLRTTWGFTAGFGTSVILQTVIANMDKVILSKFLKLEVFGYYSIASVAANTLTKAASPVSSALFPRFTQMIEQRDMSNLVVLYHRSCQLIAAITLPLMAMLVFFPTEVLSVWTGDRMVVEHSSLLMVVLIIGAAMCNLVTVPGIVSVSFGWMTLTLMALGLGVIVMLPLMLVATRFFGAVGAAVVVSSWYACVALMWPLFLHRRLMKREMGNWYVKDTLVPLGVALVLGWASRVAYSSFSGSLLPCWIVPVLCVFGSAIFLGTLMSMKELRSSVVDWRRARI